MNNNDYKLEIDDIYKKGLAYQRELFKKGKDGTGQNNYDQMCDAVENLKSDLKGKILKNGNRRQLERIENIIKWYRKLELTYTKRTEEGETVIFPRDIDQRINNNLTIAYEILVDQMELLDLL